MAKKIHRIYHGKFWCPVVRIEKGIEFLSYHGWKTYCGEILWPEWKGTTESKNVTCKRCLICKPCCVKK